MIDKPTEEELIIFETLRNPIACAEILFDDFDNLSSFSEDKFGHVRIHQFPFLAFDSQYLDDEKLSIQENFNQKKGMAEGYNLGGRGTGKTLFSLIIDCLVATFNHTYKWGAVESCDDDHVKTVMEKIVTALEFHPILKLLETYKNTQRKPYRITSNNGCLLESVNDNLYGKDTGKHWFGKHCDRVWCEESSFVNKEVTNSKLRAVSELGVVERFSGMTTFTKVSPMGEIFDKLENKSKIINVPSLINPSWNEEEDRKAQLQFGGKNCFDDKTQILTDKGWKSIENIDINDKVVSWNINNNKTTYEKINNIFKYDHDGTMYSFNNLFIDFLVTDNHKIPFRTLKKDYRLISLNTVLSKKVIKKEYSLKETENCLTCGKILKKIGYGSQKYFCSIGCKNKYTSQYIYYPVNKLHINQNMNWKGINPKYIYIDKTKYKIEDFLTFLGWFISEGCVCEIKEKRKNNEWIHWRINIYQSKSKEYIDEISMILRKMNLRDKYYKGNFVFTNKKLAKYLIENCGKYSINKKVPQFIRNLSPRLINIFLDSFNKGDGDGKRERYWSISPQLINDLQELIIKSGNYASICSRNDRKNIIYEITERKSNKEPTVYVDKINLEKYNGRIWCVETNLNNTIYIRRNNKCMWSGNSVGYQVQILGKVIENDEAVFNMEEVRKTYIKDNPIKAFEINKNNYFRFKDILILNRPENSEKMLMAMDIGEGGAPTEIIILSYTNGIYKYIYNITVFKLSSEEHYELIEYIMADIKVNLVGIDVTSGGGKAIFSHIAKKYADHLIGVSFNENIEIDFERNEKGEYVYDNQGHIQCKKDRVDSWSIQWLKKIFYNEKIKCLMDMKMDSQFGAVIAKSTAQGKMLYDCKIANHLFQAFQVFSIMDFLTERKNIEQVQPRKLSLGVALK